jgi:O-antigen/teichoic acid export membrane protein
MDSLKRLSSSQFLRHNMVFFFGSLAVGALNYLYYPVVGRLLAPAAFGEVQTLVSIFLQLTIFLTVLSLVIVNIVRNTEDEQQRNALVFEFERFALLASLGLLVVTLLFGPRLQAFLQFESAWPFPLLALCMVLSVPFILRGALLRGKQRFGLVSAGNLVAAGAKILFSALLVALGFGTIGAIAGIAVAQGVGWAFVGILAFRLGLKRQPGKRLRLPDMRLLRPELRYGAFVLLGSLAITLQYSLDVVIVKHYFDAHLAGLYAGIATVARIIFFLTASISQVLISSVRMDYGAQKNRLLLLRSAALLCALSLPALALLMLAPEPTIRLLMGSTYDALAHLLPKLGVAIFVVSIINLITSYYLALRRYGIAVAVFLGVAVTYGLMLWRHQTPEAVVNSLLLGSLSMLALTGAWIISVRLKGGALWQAKN